MNDGPVTSGVNPPQLGLSTTLYERVGGMPFFVRLVDEFYVAVAADPDLLALYPDPVDLGPARQRLALFLAQYWGGPQTYSEQRGHPRLRMRHLPYPIDVAARDRWLRAMRAAVDATTDDELVRARLWTYFESAADAMRNTEERPVH